MKTNTFCHSNGGVRFHYRFRFFYKIMDSEFKGMFEQDDEMRRNELIRKIEHSVENLTLPELEALYYDMLTKDYLK